MRAGMRFAICCLLAVVLPAAPPIRAQDAAEAGQPTVFFGTVAADKGTIASLPIYVNGGLGGLSRLAVSVDFISNSVKFESLDTSASSNSPDSKVVIEAQELPPDPKGLPRTRLKLAAESPKGFTNGLLAFLNFRLAADAKPFAVSLLPAEITAQDAKGQPVKPITEAGKVIVSAEDEEVIGCFFFTH